MVHDRVELYVRLARLAHKSGDEYWAYRFSAWSTHYVQDLCQPYHSKLIPFADIGYYTKYVFTWDKKAFEKRALQILANRHFAYEGFVAYVLTRSYTHHDSSSVALADALRKGVLYKDVDTGFDVAQGVMGWSADSAVEIDEKISDQWGHILDREDFFLLKDKSGVIDTLLPQVKYENNPLVDFTKKNFTMAGESTRTMIQLMLVPPSGNNSTNPGTNHLGYLESELSR